MYKFILLLLLIFLSSCYSFKETNELAIPPIAKDEIKITTQKK